MLLKDGTAIAAAGTAAAAPAAAAGRVARGGAASPQNAPFATPKHHATVLKDGTTSKNMLPRGLTSLLDSGKNKAIAAAEPACCCCCF